MAPWGEVAAAARAPDPGAGAPGTSAPRPTRAPEQRQPGARAGLTHARACLLDHAAELQAALVDLTREPVSVDVGPRSLEQATRAWDQAP
jgi:hypothetical protein